MKKIRECGYGLDVAEQFDAINCIAAPIFNDTGFPVATIWTTAPADRLPEKRFDEVGELIAKHALRISNRLGYHLI